MSDYGVVFDQHELKLLLEGTHGPVGRMLSRVGVKFQRNAVALSNTLIYDTAPGRYIRTGRYRSSLQWNLGKDGKGLFVECGSNVEYAEYLELGTVHMYPRPIIVPAARAAAATLGA